MELSNEILVKLQEYFSGQMDDESKRAFESEIAASRELQEFIAIYERLDHLEDDASWEFESSDTESLKEAAQAFRSKDVETFSQKVSAFREGSRDSTSSPKRINLKWAGLAVAACLGLLLYWVLSGSPAMDRLYEQNSSWQELPSFAIKGDSSQTQNVQIENAFKDQDYQQTIRLSEALLGGSEAIDPSIYLYKGVAHLELDQYEAALTTLEILANSNATDHHKAYWYMALVHLKKGDRQATIQALERVVEQPTHYKAETAKQLLEKLK